MNPDIQFTRNLPPRNPDRPLAEPRDCGQRLSLFQVARAMGLHVGGSQIQRVSPFRRRGYTAPPVGSVDVSADGCKMLPVPRGVARALRARG